MEEEPNDQKKVSTAVRNSRKTKAGGEGGGRS